LKQHLAATAFLVPDYDEGIAFFTQALRFTLLQDTALAPDKRWVVVSPAPDTLGGALLLARAANAEQRAAIGNQTGGRVGFFLHTSDFDDCHRHMLTHGVQFKEAPRHEPYGRVAVFADRWGNLWDLIEPN
jgi:catechol 2,3-dioxygenase-like lactoylglutathione lyase family enzyme